MTTRAHRVTNLFPLLLAGLLAGMSYWLEVATRSDTKNADGRHRHDPDYFVANFNVRRFDAEGALQHTLIANMMRHYPDDDITEVDVPRIIYHRAPGTLITSRTARVDGKGEHVRLIDEVRITRASVDRKLPSTLTTAHLDVYPDDEIARTDVPVLIVQGLSNIRGDAMESNNKTATHVLDGAVRGIFFRNGGVRSVVQTQTATPAFPAETATSRPRPVAEPRPKDKPQAKPPAKPKAKVPPKSQTKPKR